MNQKWLEVLTPVFGIEKVAEFTIVAAADAGDEDRACCDFLRNEANDTYNDFMENNEFVKTTCCEFETHNEHDSCPA